MTEPNWNPDPPGFIEWLEGLDDRELVNFRFELYDRCRVADRDSDTYRFACYALWTVYGLSACRAGSSDFRILLPEVDVDDLIAAIDRARRESGIESEMPEIVLGVLESQERRLSGFDDDPEGDGG